MIPDDGFELPHTAARAISVLRQSSRPLVWVSVLPIVFCVAWVPGLRPKAPKRNVIVGLVYLYVLAVGGGLLFELLT